MSTINSLIDLVFADADAAHKQHLATETLQEHEALGEFYASVREAVDTTAEVIIALGQIPDGEPDMLARLQATYRARQIAIGAAYLKAIWRLTRLRDRT